MIELSANMTTLLLVSVGVLLLLLIVSFASRARVFTQYLDHMAGIKLKPPAGDVVKACFAEKLLTVSAGENVLRVLPPLNISDDDLREVVERLSRALASLPKSS